MPTVSLSRVPRQALSRGPESRHVVVSIFGLLGSPGSGPFGADLSPDLGRRFVALGKHFQRVIENTKNRALIHRAMSGVSEVKQGDAQPVPSRPRASAREAALRRRPGPRRCERLDAVVPRVHGNGRAWSAWLDLTRGIGGHSSQNTPPTQRAEAALCGLCARKSRELKLPAAAGNTAQQLEAESYSKFHTARCARTR